MTRTIEKIKKDALNYLGFPETTQVNFGTEANDYTDADGVGAIVNAHFDDVLENCLRTYDWSFAREDGIIYGNPAVMPDTRFRYTQTIEFDGFLVLQAVFGDPHHRSKAFEWKMYGNNEIRFNLPKLYVEYTTYGNVENYPAYFARYIAISLALEICVPLRLESKLGALLQLQASMFLDARKQDSMSEPAPADFDNILDDARNIL